MTHEWEKIHRTRKWGIYPEIYMVRLVKQFMKKWKGNGRPMALDIGCGVGSHSYMMCNEGMTVIATDVSKTAIKRMNEDLDTTGPLITAFCSDISSDEFAENTFDFILDNLSLTYLEHPPWDRILSWLKPGGWLVHASFEMAPKGTPRAWEHTSPGTVVERHSIWVEGNAFSLVVRKYVKPS